MRQRALDSIIRPEAAFVRDRRERTAESVWRMLIGRNAHNTKRRAKCRLRDRAPRTLGREDICCLAIRLNQSSSTFCQYVNSLASQRCAVWEAHFHSPRRNRPNSGVKVEFAPTSEPQLSRSRGGPRQQHKPGAYNAAPALISVDRLHERGEALPIDDSRSMDWRGRGDRPFEQSGRIGLNEPLRGGKPKYTGDSGAQPERGFKMTLLFDRPDNIQDIRRSDSSDRLGVKIASQREQPLRFSDGGRRYARSALLRKPFIFDFVEYFCAKWSDRLLYAAFCNASFPRLSQRHGRIIPERLALLDAAGPIGHMPAFDTARMNPELQPVAVRQFRQFPILRLRTSANSVGQFRHVATRCHGEAAYPRGSNFPPQLPMSEYGRLWLLEHSGEVQQTGIDSLDKQEIAAAYGRLYSPMADVVEIGYGAPGLTNIHRENKRLQSIYQLYTNNMRGRQLPGRSGRPLTTTLDERE